MRRRIHRPIHLPSYCGNTHDGNRWSTLAEGARKSKPARLARTRSGSRHNTNLCELASRGNRRYARDRGLSPTWQTLTGGVSNTATIGAVAAVATSTSIAHVVVLDANPAGGGSNYLWGQYSAPGTFTGWTRIGAQGWASEPVVVSTAANALDVFAVANTVYLPFGGTVWQASFRNNSWSAPVQIPGALGSIAAVRRNAGVIDIVGRDQGNGAIWWETVPSPAQAGTPFNWQQLTGYGRIEAPSLCESTYSLELMDRTSDGGIYHQHLDVRAGGIWYFW